MKGFFSIESIPNVMFLYESTTFKDCKLINNHLTKEEYKKAVAKYEKEYIKKVIVKKVEKKSEKKKIFDKSLKEEISDK